MNTQDHGADLAAVTCTDHNMLAAACCALLSAARNVETPARLFLIVLDPTPDDMAAVSDFARTHQIAIKVLPFQSTLLPRVSSGRWPSSALTRLFLDRILPPDIQRLLYIDADTLVVRPIDALRRISMMGKQAAAVDDFIMAFPKKIALRREKIGLGSTSAYFNSGVILFDWPATIAGGTLETARMNIDRFSENYHAADQDALNAALEGGWIRLSPRWNAQTGFLPDISSPVIVHFTGRRKPWQERSAWLHREYLPVYRSYLAGTRWEIPEKRAVGERAASFILHIGKSIEGIRKSRALRGYLNRSDGRDIWKNGNE